MITELAFPLVNAKAADVLLASGIVTVNAELPPMVVPPPNDPVSGTVASVPAVIVALLLNDPPAEEVIVIDKSFGTVPLALSVKVILKLKVPVAFGLPDIVLPDKVNPPGSEPLVKVYVYGDVPPDAERA